MLQPDQVIGGRFRVDAMVGGGGTADVYRVEHLRLRSTHALKVLHDAHGPDARESLLLEGVIQANLANRHIIRVTDIIEEGDTPMLVMDYVNGPSLADWIASGLPERREPLAALAIFRGIMQGVHAAHKDDLVHRDLNTANVLIDMSDKRNEARIADFGLALYLDPARSPIQPIPYKLVGTPEYTAPEQLDDPSRIDTRADMFSLGCILYELLCQEVAFAAETAEEAIHLVKNGLYEPPTSHVPDMPVALQRVIRELLQVDPEKRTPNCRVLSRSLEMTR